MAKHSMAAIAVAALLLAACGGAEDEAALAAENAAELSSRNGLSKNGLSRNGLSRNGLSRNGLSRNGLSSAALGSTEFKTWFNQDPASSAEVMTYVVKCAMSKTQSLTYKPSKSVTYTWPGNLGLAPVWSSGQVATPAEEQLISACLGAHVNAYGINLDLSIRGYKTDGSAIPLDPDEATTFTSGEGCFFGNFFADEGIYVGYNSGTQSANLTTPRGCAIEAGTPGVCPPLVHVGMCNQSCTRPSGGSTPWKTCTVNGKAYNVVTTFLNPVDVYSCGDGVCQFTESAATCSKDCL